MLTDYSDHQQFMNGDQMLRAGGDLWMSGATGGALVCETESNSYMQALRRAAKNTTYMWLNAEVCRQNNIEAGGDPTYIVEYHETLNVWVTVLTIFDVVMGLVVVVLRVRKTKRYKQQNRA